jgi:hypothetical protein
MLNARKLSYAINKGFLGKEEISQKTKMSIYISTYIPKLLYGSESWVKTDKQKQNIQTAEMKHLKRVIGKARRDNIRNKMIRTNLGTKPFITHGAEPFLRSCQLCSYSRTSSLNVRDQVSHPYRTTGKITVLYILILIFLDSRREDKRFRTE